LDLPITNIDNLSPNALPEVIPVRRLFYFLKACKDNRYKIIVTAKKAVNKNYELGMKVPCRLELSAEEKYMIILKERLSKLLWVYSFLKIEHVPAFPFL